MQSQLSARENGRDSQARRLTFAASAATRSNKSVTKLRITIIASDSWITSVIEVTGLEREGEMRNCC